MYQILMNVLCLDGYSEVLPDDRENTELVVEDLMALILLDIFGAVDMNRVHVTYTPSTAIGSSHCHLQVHACTAETSQTSLESLEALEIRVENHTCCALIELFSTVLVNKVLVRSVSEPDRLPRSA